MNICFFCFLGFSHYGQQFQQFEGRYTLNENLSGYAVYQFHESGNRNIKHGNFKFDKVNIEEDDLDEMVESLSLEGNYRQNIKSGMWQYRYHELTKSRLPTVKDHEIVYAANGDSYIATTSFVDGKIHGAYEILHTSIDGSTSTDSLYFFRTGYTEGLMQGNFSGKSENISVQGYIDGLGKPDGEWQITHITSTGPIVEYRSFDSGILKDHFFRMQGEILNVHHIGLDVTEDQVNEIWETLPLTPKYFKVIFQTSIGLKEITTDDNTISLIRELIENGNTFLEKSLIAPNIHNERKIWELSEGSSPAEPVKVKLRKYPYAEDEKERYNTARNILSEINSITRNYFEDSHIEIGRHTHQNIYFNYRVMELIRDRTADLAPVVEMLSDNSSEYIDRNELLIYTSPSIAYPSSVSYTFNEEEYTEVYNFPTGFTAANVTFTQLFQHLQEVLKRAGEINRDTEGTLAQYRTRTELQLQEDDLLKKRDSIMGLFSNSGNNEDYNDWHLEVSTTVIVYAEKIFATYASLPLEEKVMEIEQAFDCYEALEGLYSEIADIPRKLNRVDELYTRTIWNPYTFTYMDERVKERLYRSYENDIFPFVWNDFKDNIDCNTIDVKMGNIENLYRKMISLREEDTRDLERQIRRARNNQELINLLGLQLN